MGSRYSSLSSGSPRSDEWVVTSNIYVRVQGNIQLLKWDKEVDEGTSKLCLGGIDTSYADSKFRVVRTYQMGSGTSTQLYLYSKPDSQVVVDTNGWIITSMNQNVIDESKYIKRFYEMEERVYTSERRDKIWCVRDNSPFVTIINDDAINSNQYNYSFDFVNVKNTTMRR
jgi:hypothetical protein